MNAKLSGIDVRLLMASPERRLIHEGPLVDEASGKKVYLFLLSDMFIIAKDPDRPERSTGLLHTLRR